MERTIEFCDAAVKGRVEVLEALLPHINDINEPAYAEMRDAHGYRIFGPYPPISWAVLARQLDAVVFLLQHGARVTFDDWVKREGGFYHDVPPPLLASQLGDQPLMVAVGRAANRDIADLLLTHGASATSHTGVWTKEMQAHSPPLTVRRSLDTHPSTKQAKATMHGLYRCFCNMGQILKQKTWCRLCGVLHMRERG